MRPDVATVLAFLAGALAAGWLRPGNRAAAARGVVVATALAALARPVSTVPALLGLAAGVATFAWALPHFWDSSPSKGR